MIKELFPDVKTVGILYCSAEPNSKYQATQIEAALDADGIAYKEYTASDSNDITSVVHTAVSEVDVIYIPTDNTMANNTETINDIPCAFFSNEDDYGIVFMDQSDSVMEVVYLTGGDVRNNDTVQAMLHSVRWAG